MLSKLSNKKSLKIIRKFSTTVFGTVLGIITLSSFFLVFKANEFGLNAKISDYPNKILEQCSLAMRNEEFSISDSELTNHADSLNYRHLIIYDRTINASIDKLKYNLFFKDIYSSLQKEPIILSKIKDLNEFDQLFLLLIINLNKYRQKDLLCLACYNHQNNDDSIYLLKNNGISINSLWNKNINYESLIDELKKRQIRQDTKSDFEIMLAKIKNAYSNVSPDEKLIITYISDFNDDTGKQIERIEDELFALSSFNNLRLNLIAIPQKKEFDNVKNLIDQFYKHFGYDINSINISEKKSCKDLIADIIPAQYPEKELMFTYPYSAMGGYFTPKTKLRIGNSGGGEYLFSFNSKDKISNIPVLNVSSISEEIKLPLNQNLSNNSLTLRAKDEISLGISRLSIKDFNKTLFVNIFSVDNGLKHSFRLYFSKKLKTKTSTLIYIFTLILTSILLSYVLILFLFTGVHYIKNVGPKEVTVSFLSTIIIISVSFYYVINKNRFEFDQVIIYFLSTLIPGYLILQYFKHLIQPYLQ